MAEQLTRNQQVTGSNPVMGPTDMPKKAKEDPVIALVKKIVATSEVMRALRTEGEQIATRLTNVRRTLDVHEKSMAKNKAEFAEQREILRRAQEELTDVLIERRQTIVEDDLDSGFSDYDSRTDPPSEETVVIPQGTIDLGDGITAANANAPPGVIVQYKPPEDDEPEIPF